MRTMTELPGIDTLRRRPCVGNGRQIFGHNVDFFGEVGLSAPIRYLVGVINIVIGSTGIGLALAGLSAIPALCVVLGGVAILAGIRWAVGPWPTYRWSVAYICSIDVVILVAIANVTSINIGMVKMSWLALIGVYAGAMHGRLMLAFQVCATGMAVVVGGCTAIREGAAGSTGMFITAAVALMLFSLTTMFAVRLGRNALQRYASRYERLAHHDSLTGLLNRRGLGRDLRELLLIADRDDQVATMLIDLDRFKLINDEFGHEVGDNVLMDTAARLRAAVAANGVVARLGGEEFVAVAVVGCHDIDDWATYVHGAAQNVDDVCAITSSGGVASTAVGDLRSGRVTLEHLVGEADARMYQAKAQGGGRVVLGSTSGGSRREVRHGAVVTCQESVSSRVV